MTKPQVQEQAGELMAMIGRLMRNLFSLETGDLANELSVAHIRACNTLYDAPKPITEIARELGITTSAATQLADRLQRSGLVERVVSLQDRRVKLLHLTESGKQLIGGRRTRRVNRMALALDRLSEEQREAVLAAMRVLSDAGVAVNKP
ncbi:MAG: MarR family winged helix-turn-helix transcriptional regulator [Armatimonadota bacterium]